MKGRATMAVLALALLWASLPAEAARLPRWARDRLEQVDLDRFGEVDAVVLYAEWSYRLFGGARRGTQRRIVHLLTEDGEDEAVFVLTSSKLRSHDNTRVWVRCPSRKTQRYSTDDGTLVSSFDQKIMDDTLVLIVAPPDLSPGCTVVLDTEYRTTDDIPQDVFTIQRDVPVAHAVISLDARKGWGVEGRASGIEPETGTGPDGEQTWTFRDVRPLPERGHSSSPVPPSAVFALNYIPPGGTSPFATWNGVARWAAENFRLPEDAGAVAAAQGKGAGVPLAAATARGLRYFSIALGTGAYVPRRPALTMERGFGDCKDKAQVMIDLLRREGQEAWPVLIVAPRDRYVPEDLPGPFFFNHAVVAIPWHDRPSGPEMTIVDHPELGRLRIYDATMSRHSPTDTSLAYDGAATLVVHPDTQSLVFLPRSSADDNRSERHFRWTVTEDGVVDATVTLEARGAMRDRFQSVEGTLVDAEELLDDTRLMLTRAGLRFESLQVQPLQQRPDGTWTYEATYRLPAAVGRFGTVRTLELGRFFDVDWLPLPDDEEPYIPMAGRWSDRFDIDYPGKRFVGTDPATEVRNALGEAALTLTQQEGSLRVDRVVALSSQSPDDLQPEPLTDLRRSIRAMNQVVLLFE